MSIEKSLSSSILNDRSKANINRLVAEVTLIGLDWEGFFEELALIPTDKSWRMFWFLSHYCELNPNEATKNQTLVWLYLKSSKNLRELRDLWRCLTFVKIQKELHAEVYNLSLNTFLNYNMAIAVRVNALIVAYNVSTFHRDFKQELILVLNNFTEAQSAGIQAKSRNILKLLQKN